MQHCTGPPDEHDKQQPGVYDHDENDILSHVIEQFLPLGVAPVYPTDSNCNARGLTDLGDHAVRKLMQNRIIIDPDHLSVKARKSVMDLIEAARYSGAVSSHSWSTVRRDPADLQARRRGHADEGVRARLDQDLEEDEGAARQALLLRLRLRLGPERPGVAARAARRASHYPFKSFDGKVTFERQRSGERLFDFTKDGVAHYGLFPDWWEDVRTTAGGAAR